jgi:hypothetical protein
VTRFAIQFLGKETAPAIEPVDDWVGVLWHRGGVDDKGVP